MLFRSHFAIQVHENFFCQSQADHFVISYDFQVVSSTTQQLHFNLRMPLKEAEMVIPILYEECNSSVHFWHIDSNKYHLCIMLHQSPADELITLLSAVISTSSDAISSTIWSKFPGIWTFSSYVSLNCLETFALKVD